ncbi:hypothetical protein GCM10010245_89980 [Streptomyces spectabilis]|nr:hypothetical protein GCM10010245_89980 [Streptomyces spectabilis]
MVGDRLSQLSGASGPACASGAKDSVRCAPATTGADQASHPGSARVCQIMPAAALSSSAKNTYARQAITKLMSIDVRSSGSE